MAGRVAVLLGAGASRDAGLPDSWEMTNQIDRHFESSHGGRTLHILRFVASQLLAEAGTSGAPVFRGVDVERVLTAIQLLADRRDLEISPFVHSWNPAVEALDAPDDRTGSTLRRHRRVQHFLRALRVDGSGLPRSNPERELEKLLSEFDSSPKPTSGDAFRRAFDAIRHSLLSLLSDPGDTSYLAPLLALAETEGTVPVATLNYDRTVEIEAERTSVPVDTGLATWHETGEWSWASSGIHLLKLHGSIDWKWTAAQTTQHLEPRRVVVDEDGSRRASDPAIIFGGRNKLTAEGPFLDLLAEFEGKLSGCRSLIVVGYSFRDDHVNEAVRRWLEVSETNRMVVVDPGFPSKGQWVGRGDFRHRLRIHLQDKPGTPAVTEQRLGDRISREARPEVPPTPSRIAVIQDGARGGLPLAVSLACSSEPWSKADVVVTA